MKILRNHDLAKIMGLASGTIEVYKCKKPHALPPTRIVGGVKVWIDDDVNNWLCGLPVAPAPHQPMPIPTLDSKRGRGRPSKAEQVASLPE